jgi:hypothetical protein
MASYRLFSPNPLSNLFEPSRTILNLRLKILSRNFDPADLVRVKWFYVYSKFCRFAVTYTEGVRHKSTVTNSLKGCHSPFGKLAIY